MKFDEGKAWPHPVLRPPKYGDDYPDADFEVEINFRKAKSGTSGDLVVDLTLSSPELRNLVEKNFAQYALLINSPQTHFRELLTTRKERIKKQFPSGLLAGWVEFQPFLVLVRDLLGFRASEWHSDFEGQAFDISVGSVLAEDESKRYFVSTEYENLIGSIFKIRTQSDLPDGRWTYHIEEDHIWISMSQKDSQIFEDVRIEHKAGAEGYYLINGIYLPALVASLTDIDRNLGDYSDFKWFSSLDLRLEEVGCKPLGTRGINRVEDAQKIFDSPFLKMPILAEKSGR